MKKNFIKRLSGAVTAFMLAVSVILAHAYPVRASGLVVVPGTAAGSKAIDVTAEIEAAFVVSLPASITLKAGTRKDANNTDVPGYWYDLRVGAAGKLDSAHRVYIRPQLPCTLTGAKSGASVSMKRLNTESCKVETWDKNTIGSCDWGETGLTNMNYAYCCTDGHAIGVPLDDITSFDSYAGMLTINFGVEAVTP